MRFGFANSFAALLLGAGLVVAQTPSGPRTTARGTEMPKDVVAHNDVTYPQAATQQINDSSLADAHGNECFGGVSWGDRDDSYRFYFELEYLIWHLRNPSLPPLTTIVPVGLVQVAQPISVDGVLQRNSPVFSIPFQLSSDPGVPRADSVSMGDHNGLRITTGIWLDDAKDVGIELGGFFIEKLTQQIRSTTANVDNQFSLDTGVQAQFYLTDGNGGQQLASTQAVVVPAQGISDVIVRYSSELWGGELNCRTAGCRIGDASFEGLVGVRYINFEEQLGVNNNVAITDVRGSATGAGFGVLPANFQSFDRIIAKNRIVAPQVGADAELSVCNFFLHARGKVAVGADFQEVESSGHFTSTTPNGGTITGPGGLLTGAGNQGEISRTHVVVIPEVNLKVGYQLGDSLRAWIGYDALYMEHVVRPSQQVSFTNTVTNLTVANSSTTLGVRQPVIVVRDQGVWVQGANLGFELRF